MKLIVGLGNVGSEYAGTRHNVGFLVVQELAQRHRVALAQDYREGRRTLARYGEWTCDGQVVRCMIPHTLMNRSGDALAALSSWQVMPGELLVVCDDVNLPLGTLRLRAGGSAGGHLGLDSCLTRLGTEDVGRLRVGIGVSPLPKDLTEFVLSPFRTVEQPIIRETLTRAVEGCELWSHQGMEKAMNDVNQRNVA